MAANTNPIFARGADQQWFHTDGDGGAAGPLKTANTALDGTGTSLTIYTAPADGGYVEDLICAHAGTNVATVIRVFLADGAGTALGDSVKIAEQTLPATTASANSAVAQYRVPIRMAIPAGYRLRVTLGTTVASGYFITANAAKY